MKLSRNLTLKCWSRMVKGRSDLKTDSNGKTHEGQRNEKTN
jgi:hypothetical protein